MDFSASPTGMQFQLFGPHHLLVMGLVLAANLSLLPLRRLLGEGARRGIRYLLAFLLVLAEVTYMGWRAYAGIFTLQEALPLHLCSVMAFVGAAALVSRSATLYAFTYFLGIGGAAQALITPEIGIYGFPHVRFFTSAVLHGGLITAALYLTVVEGFRPSWRAMGRVIAGLLLYLGFVGVINSAVGSNYLFIARKPPFPTLIDDLGPWPWYILSLFGVGLLSMLLLYSPFIVLDWRSARRRSRPSAI
jgi:hypothetical integral membrane protein (TIGR02206 family)